MSSDKRIVVDRRRLTSVLGLPSIIPPLFRPAGKLAPPQSLWPQSDAPQLFAIRMSQGPISSISPTTARAAGHPQVMPTPADRQTKPTVMMPKIDPSKLKPTLLFC